ncbi:MAG: S1C family serine protease [Actinomycetes bacterium]
MSDEPRSPGGGPDDGTPWWSRPSGDSWDAPSYASHPAEGQGRADEPPTQPVYAAPEQGQHANPQPHAYGPSRQPQAAPPQPYAAPSHPYSGPPSPGWAGDRGRPDEFDTLGRAPTTRKGPGTGLLVTLALLIALLAGGTGGAAGYLLAQRGDDVAVDGADLGAAPSRSVERPAGSIPAVAEGVLPSVVQIKVETSEGRGTGSGFVIDDDGLVLTNNHVVAGADGADMQVAFQDGTTTSARLVGRSDSYDLAVLKVSAKNLTPLRLGNSDDVVVGDPVIAIGSPLGLSGTVTSGIVSALNRPVTAGDRGSDDSAYINAVQTDAAINPGNSGGPLVNLDGEVVGVNSAIATVGSPLPGEGGNIGVGFAIPINQARLTAEQLIKTGEAQFPIIGASLDGAYQGEGARIADSTPAGSNPPVLPDGPADRAGLRPGDVIVEIDGKPVEDSAQLIVAIRSKRPGESVSLTVRRDGDERNFEVELGSSNG